MRLLITGGLGFVGSHLVRLVLRERPEWSVTNLDLVTYAGNPANLADVDAGARYRLVRGDVADPAAVAGAMDGCGAVVHVAAETHVDRSILDASEFARTNVLGTQVVVDAARARGIRLVVVSTDEVYGPLHGGAAPRAEDAPLAPTSPYAASKAGGDLLALAAARTHGADVVVTRCTNNYGPCQFPEKLVALVAVRALEGQPIPVYGDGRQVRDWLHVEDHAAGILAALERGAVGEVYHLGARCERENLEVVRRIVAALGADVSLVSSVADRPGHDRRYALDPSRAERELGWRPRWKFEDGLAATAHWYREHAAWWRAVMDGSYRAFERVWYEERGS